jgi:hypothetical protein
MKNNWNYLHSFSNGLFFNLFRLCPAKFDHFSPDENTWNQLNNWKKIIPVYKLVIFNKTNSMATITTTALDQTILYVYTNP